MSGTALPFDNGEECDPSHGEGDLHEPGVLRDDERVVHAEVGSPVQVPSLRKPAEDGTAAAGLRDALSAQLTEKLARGGLPRGVWIVSGTAQRFASSKEAANKLSDALRHAVFPGLDMLAAKRLNDEAWDALTYLAIRARDGEGEGS